MEAQAAERGEDITDPDDGPDRSDGEPYLKPVRGRKVELDEEASPTASRRFTRT